MIADEHGNVHPQMLAPGILIVGAPGFGIDPARRADPYGFAANPIVVAEVGNVILRLVEGAVSQEHSG